MTLFAEPLRCFNPRIEVDHEILMHIWWFPVEETSKIFVYLQIPLKQPDANFVLSSDKTLTLSQPCFYELNIFVSHPELKTAVLLPTANTNKCWFAFGFAILSWHDHLRGRGKVHSVFVNVTTFFHTCYTHDLIRLLYIIFVVFIWNIYSQWDNKEQLLSDMMQELVA